MKYWNGKKMESQENNVGSFDQENRLAALPLAEQYPQTDEDAFFYLRFSEDEPEAAANSIENQRKFLKRYVKEHAGLLDYRFGELADDGYTGTNFDRPAVKKLLDLIRRGRVRCILVKDYSRFCRNYIALGDYLEQIFPVRKIRFISVLDGYDSQRADILSAGREISYRGFMNDYYSRDISRKVTAQKRLKMKDGKYIGPYAPYGFLKSEREKGRLAVNPETAPVVRLIYELEIQGLSDGRTARELNRRKIPPPLSYRRRRKPGGECGDAPPGVWERSSVAKIVTDIRNVGDMETHKWYRPVPCTRKAAAVAKEERFVTGNTHPGIVTREEYELAMEQRRRRATGRKTSRAGIEHALSGKFRCARCKRQLLRHVHGDGKADYMCPRAYSAPGCGCPADHIREECVLEALERLLSLHELLARLSCGQGGIRREMPGGACSEAEGARRTAERMENRKYSLYEDLKRGRISAEKFMLEKQRLEREIRQARTLKEQLCGRRAGGESKKEEAAYDKKKELRRAVLSFVKEITWHGNQEITIEVRYGMYPVYSPETEQSPDCGKGKNRV